MCFTFMASKQQLLRLSPASLVCCSSSCKSAFKFKQSTAFLLCERAMTKPKLAASVSKSAYKPNLVPRVFRLFGQRSNAADD